ncbi:Hypothetical Protein FCC1311_075302 [Hondaea fermentalgiana]|uniref:Polysaccharide pyruvyl transferase domain-containing protein n=1 Tax=Hondaea fermentalgiana TaxID=2315210 RepID=A0A2R5GKA3_9STRA|nr:Hypothetical Protein FCC1311_075302 [Hondaea fermentalgiana]|eukprot:GBG31307.1 Hypothetical Protein FCC1311_075302 [Hondaea fermentalgiana]
MARLSSQGKTIFGFAVMLFAMGLFLTRMEWTVINSSEGSFEDLSSSSTADLVEQKGSLCRPDGRQHYVLWLYDAAAPGDAVCPDDTVICAYTRCREAFPDSASINLRELARFSKYERFIAHHAFQKIRLGMNFPHHVQSIAILLKAAESSYACARTLGEPRADAICTEQLTNFADFDPEADDVAPILRPTFNVDMPEFYSVLDYEEQVQAHPNLGNAGDEMQVFGGSQFFPYVTDFIERDKHLPESRGHIVLNAWWGYDIPWLSDLETVNPIAVSMHVSGAAQKMVQKNIDWFKSYNARYGAIGARDTATHAFFQRIGIRSYFSACMTLTIDVGSRHNPSRFGVVRSTIYNIDARGGPYPPGAKDPIKRLPQGIQPLKTIWPFRVKRYEYAYGLATQYAENAKVVITSRIHSALPANAQGASVIFVDTPKLPGGGGNRTAGLLELFHIQKEGEPWKFDVNQMPANPGVHKSDRYRAAFWNTFRRRSKIYEDSARLFGNIPLLRLGKGVHFESEPLHDSFHFVFNEDAATIKWRMVRAVEFVLYHHPNARVVIYSNTLSPTRSRFAVLAEAGYDVFVEPYDVNALAGHANLDAKTLLRVHEVLDNIRSSKYARLHESQLVRLLALYSRGGVYLDMYRFVVRPFKLAVNDVWNSGTDPFAALIFQAGSKLLETLVKEYLAVYRPDCMSCASKQAFERASSRHRAASEANAKVPQKFSPLDAADVKRCFTAKESSPERKLADTVLAVNIDAISTKQYKSTLQGSFCDYLFHKFCVLCDEVRTSASSLEAISAYPA